MANKTYSIQINGLQESVKAVDALNSSLGELDKKIKALEGKAVKIGSTSSGGGSKSSSTGALSEEEKIQKQIEQLEEKRIAHSKEIYQNYLAAKDVLKEVDNDQKSIAATERLQAKSYSNTIAGMKQELADIKSAMQTVDLGDTDQLDKMTQRAKELNDSLKKIEESYGQFGRNVGNYASAANGFQNIRVSVGGTIREFNSAREALKTLNNELKTMAINGQQDTEAFKELRKTVMQLESAANDAKKPMDDLMDTMQGLVAIANVSHGLSAFFGFDDSEIQRSIQKLVGLQTALKGMQEISKQMQSIEGVGKIFANGSEAIDTFVSKITGAQVGVNGLTMGSKAATVAVRGLSMALKGLGIGLIIGAISMAVTELEKFVKTLDSAKVVEDALERETKALNRQYENRKDLLAGQYMSGVINNEEFLAKQYKIENEYIEKQLELLKQRADVLNEKDWIDRELDYWKFSGEYNTGYTSQKMTGATAVGSWNQFAGFSYDVKSIEEAEEAWKKLNAAVNDGKDYFSKYGEGFKDWFKSLFVTVEETKDVMHGMGNIDLSNTIGEFSELNTKFKNGEISSKDFAKQLKELVEKMNSSEVLNSVIANLDEYIPDEKVREKVNNIISYIKRLNNEFNAVSESEIHHWEQVKIDAMEEGAAKIAAQMAEDERHEIAQYGHTQEQIELIQKKYQRKRLEETNKHNKKVSSENKRHQKDILEAEKDLSNLRISNMKEGLNKVLTQLEEERKQRLAKVEADGKLVEERQAEINKLYDKKIYDAKKEWAEKVEKAYKDMWDNIYNYSLETTRKIAEVSSLSGEVNTQGHEQIKRSYYYEDVNGRDATSSYGVQGKNQLSKETQEILGLDKQINRELSDIYEVRKRSIEKYWTNRITMETRFAKDNYDTQLKLENESYQKELRDAAAHAEDMKHQTYLQYSAGTITAEQYYEVLARLVEEYSDRTEAITNEHNLKLQKLEQDKVSKLQETNANYYRERLQELRDFQTAISNLESKQPVYNAFGIINLGETKKNNENLLNSYKTLSEDIIKLKDDLQKKLGAKQISFDEFQNANRELDRFAEDVGQKMDKVKNDLKLGNQIASWIKSSQMYLQELENSFNTIMNAVWDAQDTAFDKEQEEIDKQNDILQKALDKQEEMISKHKSEIDSIESELATSRGDRRQHLIDQINAEMEAERAAHIQKQKIEQEQERQQKKQDELEKKRKKAQYKRDMLQAVVNGAMAVTMAAINSWPIPAIPMMALAGATTAAQIAIMAANKPYAKGGQLDGGVAVGPRHRDGGIPVLGGRASIEGGEFITNRQSTANNIDLLEFINSKKKKVDVSDLIDFYSSGNIKRNISGIRTKFEDGGFVPTLPNSIDVFDNRLIQSFEAYSNRPVVVSVVDINNKQADVKRVQTLAGL